MNNGKTATPTVNGGEALLHALSDAGIEHIFGYPGGAALHIYDALFTYSEHEIEHILARHEQGAVHMADGYVRSTGKLPAVLVTSGPGATNTITGIATAFMDSIPMIVISAQVMKHLIGTDSFQETDMMGISRPIVKHSFLVKDAEDIPETVAKAVYIATTGKPGPVVIDIPKDVTDPTYRFAMPTVDKDMRMRSYKPRASGNERQIRKAADLIRESIKPVLYCGGGVVQGNASKQLRKLAKMIGCPVTNTLMGLGSFPATDSHFLGMLGMHGTFEANMAMHHADLIIAVGARFDDRVTNTPAKFAQTAKVIHIDAESANIGKIINPDIPIVGSAATVLDQLIGELQRRHISTSVQQEVEAWNTRIARWRADHGLDHDMWKQPPKNGFIKPQQVVQMLYQLTEGKAFVTSDVGQHQMFAAQYYHFDEPRRWINSGGLGTMGFGVPAALGVKIANRDEKVICITGEGSVQMCLQELSTATQYNCSIVIVCLNNRALGMVKQWQDMVYGGRHSEVTYEDSLPDFKALVESYGHVGFKCSEFSDLEDTLKQALEVEDKVAFVDVIIDEQEHVYPMLVAPNGSMKDMWLNKHERTG